MAGTQTAQAARAAGGVAEPAAGIAPPSELRRLRSRGRARGIVALLGPAFVAAVAYVDPVTSAPISPRGRGSATRSRGRS